MKAAAQTYIVVKKKRRSMIVNRRLSAVRVYANVNVFAYDAHNVKLIALTLSLWLVAGCKRNHTHTHTMPAKDAMYVRVSRAAAAANNNKKRSLLTMAMTKEMHIIVLLQQQTRERMDGWLVEQKKERIQLLSLSIAGTRTQSRLDCLFCFVSSSSVLLFCFYIMYERVREYLSYMQFMCRFIANTFINSSFHCHCCCCCRWAELKAECVFRHFIFCECSIFFSEEFIYTVRSQSNVELMRECSGTH